MHSKQQVESTSQRVTQPPEEDTFCMMPKLNLSVAPDMNCSANFPRDHVVPLFHTCPNLLILPLKSYIQVKQVEGIQRECQEGSLPWGLSQVPADL